MVFVVERIDDVIAIGVDIARRIGVVTDRVGETHDIQPGDCHALAIMRRGQQLIYQLDDLSL